MCRTDCYRQPEGTRIKSVDLLFVIDTSKSLAERRKAIANSIRSFIQNLPNDVDYRMAVMLAHGRSSKHFGRLYRHDKEPTVLNSVTMTEGDIEKYLYEKLTDVKTDDDTDGGEAMMASLMRGLDSDRLSESRSTGFFRTNALLDTLFITDENDICFPPEKNGYPKAWPDYKKDSNDVEHEAYHDNCFSNGQLSVTPSRLLEKVRALQGSRPFVLSGVIYHKGSTVPKEDEHAIGHGILELITLAKGELIDITQRDFRDSLAKLGDLTALKLSLVTEYTLRWTTGVVPGTIEVWVDSRRATHAYNPLSNAVTIPLDQAGSAGSHVDVFYCKQGDLQSNRLKFALP